MERKEDLHGESAGDKSQIHNKATAPTTRLTCRSTRMWDRKVPCSCQWLSMGLSKAVTWLWGRSAGLWASPREQNYEAGLPFMKSRELTACAGRYSQAPVLSLPCCGSHWNRHPTPPPSL